MLKLLWIIASLSSFLCLANPVISERDSSVSVESSHPAHIPEITGVEYASRGEVPAESDDEKDSYDDETLESINYHSLDGKFSEDMKDELGKQLSHEDMYHEDVESDELTHDLIMDEWGKVMSDFWPDMLVSFSVHARADENFYQEVGPDPTLVRGAFFVGSSNQSNLVQFSIIDPEGQVVFREVKNEGLFYLTTNKTGIYTLVVTNPQWIGEMPVTLIFGAGNDPALSEEDATNAEKRSYSILANLRDIENENSYLWHRHKAVADDALSASNYVVWLSAVELIWIIVVIVLKLHFMKRLVSSRRLL